MGNHTIQGVDKIRNVESGGIVGRISAGEGRAELLTPSAVRSLLAVQTGAEVAALYYSKTEVDSLLTAKANASHGHIIADISGLSATLSGIQGDIVTLATTTVPRTTTLTINGTAQDLSANRSWTVGDLRSDGSYSNPTWLTGLAWSKVSGTPSTLSGYGITDAVPVSRTITAGTGLSGGGTLSLDRTISLANTTVAAGSYTLASITVDAQGRLTAASSGSVSIGSVQGLGTGVATALAVAIGSVGAPVVMGGALGTPASGNLANCTFPILNQNTTGSAATVGTISGLISPGTNVSITGSGTLASPFVINASGGGGGGITSINGNTTAAQVLTVGTAGNDFNIDSVTTSGTSVFNIPDASATARGLISTGTQTIPGNKTFSNDLTLGANLVHSGGVQLQFFGSTTLDIFQSSALRVRISNGLISTAGPIRLGSSATATDISFERDAANTLAIRNGTNAQTVNISNTWTSSTNFEYGRLQWASNEWRIGTAVGSAGGTQRSTVIGSWNAAGTFSPFLTITNVGAAAFSSTVQIGADTLLVHNVGAGLYIRNAANSGWQNISANSFGDIVGINLGANGDTRIRRVSAGIIGFDNWTGTSGFSLSTATDGAVTIRNRANSADGSLLCASATFAGGTITSSTPGITLTQTWNSGVTTFTGMLVNVTNTASASASLLADMQVNGTSVFQVARDGAVRIGSATRALTPLGSSGLYYHAGTIGTNGRSWYADVQRLQMCSDGYFGFSSTTDSGITADVRLYRDAAGVLALLNGTNAQTFRVYNTFTSAINAEWYQQSWASNTIRIGTAVGSVGGTQRAMAFGSWDAAGSFTTALTVNTSGTVTIGAYTLPATDGTNGQVLQTNGAGAVSWATVSGGGGGGSPGGSDTQIQFNDAGAFGGSALLTFNKTTGQITNAQGTLTASAPLTLSQTWNSGATLFNAAVVNVTNTASSSESFLLNLQVAGATVLGVRRDGRISAYNGTSGTSGSQWFTSSGTFFGRSDLGSAIFSVGRYSGSRVFIEDTGTPIGWGTAFTDRLLLWYQADNVLGLANGTNAQTFNIANTVTSATNFEYGRFQWNTNQFRIGTAVGSAGGTQRSTVLGTWNAAGAFSSFLSIDNTGAMVHGGATFFGPPSGWTIAADNASGDANLTIRAGRSGNGTGTQTISLVINSTTVFAANIFGTSINALGNNGLALLTSGSTRATLSSGQGNLTLTPSAATSGSQTGFTFTAPAPTGQTASTEATMVNWNLASTVTFAAGALTTQRAFRIQAPTYAFAAASTITTAATLSISGAPAAGTNATITNAYALYVENGASRFAGAVTIGAYTLPATDGTNGQVLQTNGTGTVTWATVSGGGGSPGGSDTQIQFNDAGVFGGSATLTLNKTTGQLTNAQGTLTASAPLTLTQTWNSGATAFTAALVNITDTTSSSGSLLQDWQVGGSSRVSLRKDGQMTFFGTGGGLGLAQLQGNGSAWFIYSGGTFQSPLFNCNGWYGMVDGANGGVQFYSGHGIVWSGSGTSGSLTRNSLAGDVGLFRDGAGIMAQRFGTTAQTLNLSNTWTSSTNFEYGRFQWASNQWRIGTAVGSAGGSQRATVLGTWNAAGTWSPILTLNPSGSGTWTTQSQEVTFSGSSQLYIRTAAQTELCGSYLISLIDSNSTASHGQVKLELGNGAAVFSFLNTSFSATDGLVAFGGRTSSFPALKRSGTTLQVRLADNSAAASLSALTGTFASGTITSSSPGITLTQTWNSGATTFTGLSMAITDTTSNSSSLLINTTVGGSSVFSVRKDGAVTAAWDSTFRSVQVNGSNKLDSTGLVLGNVLVMSRDGSSNTVLTSNSTGGVLLAPSGNFAELRNSTNAQTFNIANTWSSSTNFEYGRFQWNTNEFRIGTAVGSAGGTQRDTVLGAWNSAGTWRAVATVAANSGSPVFNITPFWMPGLTFTSPTIGSLTASTEFSDVNFNLTATRTWSAGALTTQRAFRIQAPTYAFASASTITTASTLSISGAPAAGTNATITNAYALNVESGISNFNGRIFITDGASSIESNSWAGATLILRNSGAVTVGLGSSGIRMALGYAISFCSDTSINNPDVFLFRDAANTLGLRNGTNAQTFRVYNTFTSATNAEWFQQSWVSNEARIGTAVGSVGGTQRAMAFGSWNAAGSFTTALTVNTSGTVTIGAYTLPATDGTSGQVLQTNGTGTVSWATVAGGGGSGSPGGDNTQVQFNDAGAFGGSSALTFNKNTTALTLTQAVQTTGSPTLFTVTGAAHTTLTASTEAVDVNVNLARTVQFSTGALTTQRAIRVQAPTYAFAGASTITTAATLWIDNAPLAGANATITNPYALYVENGAAYFGGDITMGGSLYLPSVWSLFGSTTEVIGYRSGGSYGLCMGSGIQFGWASGTNVNSAAIDVALVRDAAGTFAQRNGTSAQTFRLYNTFTSATNAEWYQESWVSNEIRIGTAVGSAGGTGRNLTIGSWNAAGTWTPALLISAASSTVTAWGNFECSSMLRFSGDTAIRRTGVGVLEVNNGTAGQYRDLVVGNLSLIQVAATSGSPTQLTITGAAHTTLTASTEATDVNMNLARTVQFAAGALTTQRAVRIQAPTYAFAGASTITTASTLAISGAPIAGTNATITNALALNVESGNAFVAGDTAVGGNIISDNVGGSTAIGIRNGAGGANRIQMLYGTGFMMASTYAVAWGPNSTNTNTPDVYLRRFGAGSLAQYDGVNPQSFSIFNTFSSTTNFERGILGWNSNEFRIGTSVGSSGGTQRNTAIGTWNTSGTWTATVTFTTAGDMSFNTAGSLIGHDASTGSGISFSNGSFTIGTMAGGAHTIHALWRMSTSAGGGTGLFLTPAACNNQAPTHFAVTTPSDTTITASNESTSIRFNCSATRTWATGALTTQREVRVQAPTYAFAAASTITSAATFAISGAPIAGSNATLTNTYALWVESGMSQFGGAINTMGSMVVNTGSHASTTGFHFLSWNSGAIGWIATGTVSAGSTPETALYRGGAYQIDFRNSTNAHCFAVYNTHTSGTDFERGVFDWKTTTNTLRVGTEKGSGGGTARDMSLVTDGTERLRVTSGGLLVAARTIGQLTETANTPSATTQTITLDSGNHQILDLSLSTGNVTVTFTVPSFAGAGSVLIKQHGTTPRNITWAVSAGTIVWLGTEPTWSSDGAGKYRRLSWYYSPTESRLILAASDSN